MIKIRPTKRPNRNMVVRRARSVGSDLEKEVDDVDERDVGRVLEVEANFENLDSSKLPVTVTIPTLNEEDFLPGCLDDLQDSIRDCKYDVEVIIVDSYSEDDTVKIAENHEVVDRVVSEEKGILKARDRGIREASGEVVVCMDADTRYPNNFLCKLVGPIIEENLAITYGRAKGEEDRKIHIDSFIRMILQNTLHLFGLAWVSGSNRALRKSVYEDLGGYDISKDSNSIQHVIYEEQFKFPLRMKKKGGIRFVPEAESFQSHRTMDQMLLKERKNGGKSWNFISHYDKIVRLFRAD